MLVFTVMEAENKTSTKLANRKLNDTKVMLLFLWRNRKKTKTKMEGTSPDRLSVGSDGGEREGGDWYTKAPTHPPLLPRAMWTE